MERIELLEQTGLLRTLLLVSQKKRFISELKKSALNPEGVGSYETLLKVRENLESLGLIREEMEEGPRPRTYLVITEKGERVAQKLKEIQDIIRNS